MVNTILFSEINMAQYLGFPKSFQSYTEGFWQSSKDAYTIRLSFIHNFDLDRFILQDEVAGLNQIMAYCDFIREEFKNSDIYKDLVKELTTENEELKKANKDLEHLKKYETYIQVLKEIK